MTFVLFRIILDLTLCSTCSFQLTRLEFENYNQQTETESTIEMNQHLQARKLLLSFLAGSF